MRSCVLSAVVLAFIIAVPGYGPGQTHNTVQVTFLPEGKTVQFENGKLPYEYHGKEQSILDVALKFLLKK